MVCPLLHYNTQSKDRFWKKNHTASRNASYVRDGINANIAALHYIGNLLNISFIIMHGTLLGWHFNQNTLPWDTDIDVSVLEGDVPKLISYSVEHSPLKDIEFIYDANPHSHIEFNVVHIPTGVYTDITSLRATNDWNVLRAKVISGAQHRFNNRPKYVMKSSVNKLWGGHIYMQADIRPIQRCMINNVSLWCPYNVPNVLRQEYPRFTSMIYHQFEYSSTTKCWTKSSPKRFKATHSIKVT